MSFFGELFGGASSQDQQLANQAGQEYGTLTAEQGEMFAQDQQLLNSVQNAWSPILSGGAYQFGFSSGELQNLNQTAINAGATATANSVAAQQLREQQMTGGANVLPTGAQEAAELNARELGSQQTATNLAGIREAGYQTGRQNFLAASGAEQNLAELTNPTGFANAAANAGNLSLGANKQVDQMNANSLTAKLLGGAITGGADAALVASPLPGSITSAFGV